MKWVARLLSFLSNRSATCNGVPSSVSRLCDPRICVPVAASGKDVGVTTAHERNWLGLPTSPKYNLSWDQLLVSIRSHQA